MLYRCGGGNLFKALACIRIEIQHLVKLNTLHLKYEVKQKSTLCDVGAIENITDNRVTLLALAEFVDKIFNGVKKKEMKHSFG